ncbi:MAG: biotin/lipoyl-binding protein [Firmicutes bacterium]|nr:biotin/lipoyl-binding protein [Bacillota bacterium]
MKKFNITVNGKSYEVEVEEIGGVMPSAPVNRPAAPVAAPTPAPSAAPVPAAKPAAPAPAAPVAGGETVTSPMPGTILDIKVNVGDTVASGAVLVILEAMKMENEIMAPVAGKVVSINVNKGASVNSGDVLVVIG